MSTRKLRYRRNRSGNRRRSRGRTSKSRRSGGFKFPFIKKRGKLTKKNDSHSYKIPKIFKPRTIFNGQTYEEFSN